jgi:nucleoid-associated protein YgaU
MANPRATKRSTWFDAKITPAQRLEAFRRLPQYVKDALKKAGYQPGSVPSSEQVDALLESLHDKSRKDVIAACRNAMLRRDPSSVNEILQSLIQIDHLARDGDQDLVDLAGRWIALILQELEHRAYITFREFPSSENYAKCWAARSMLSQLEIPWSEAYPENPWPKCMVRAPAKPGPYTVVRGDSLSKIALRFYGQANLWDAIFETNSFDGNPDLITPGTVLTIRSTS